MLNTFIFFFNTSVLQISQKEQPCFARISSMAESNHWVDEPLIHFLIDIIVSTNRPDNSAEEFQEQILARAVAVPVSCR